MPREDTQFKPGNPGGPGRKKGDISIVSILKKELEKIPKGNKKNHARMLVQRWLKNAIVVGDARSIENMVRHIDGMPKQTIDMKVDPDFDFSDEADKRANKYENNKIRRVEKRSKKCTKKRTSRVDKKNVKK